MLLQHGSDGDRPLEVEGGEVHGEARGMDEDPETLSHLRAGLPSTVPTGVRRGCRGSRSPLEPARPGG